MIRAGDFMRHPLLLTLAATLAFGPMAGAQTAPGTAGTSSISKTPSPRTTVDVRPPSTTGSGGYDMLVDFTHNFMTVQTQYSANVVSDTLAAALQRSRDTVWENSKPIPDAVRKGLVPFYPAELLENVRYTIGDTSKTGLAGFAIRNGNAAAVTLIDTIVFKDESYIGSLALWAHEMHHIEQYREWGLSGFAARYAFDWKSVEADAGAKAKEFVSWYRDRNGLK
jgi:hypothetical protein